MIYDAVVVGGGPAGMTAALYLLRSGMTTAMIEQLSPGGQVLLSEEVENYPGFPSGVKGYELADLFEKQLAAWNPVRINDEVREIKLAAPGEKTHKLLTGGNWIEAKVVILSTGSRYKRLGLPGEKELTGKGVSYCALCDGNFFRNMDVAVIGGGNTALEEALYLAKLVNKLYLIHRREDFRAHKCYQDKCEINPKIEIIRSSTVSSIEGTDKVEGVLVKNINTGEERRVDVQGVFVFVGYEPLNSCVPEGIEKDAKGYVITDSEMRTNVPGIFAAGDIRSKLCRQIITAAGDGATAANSAFAYLEQQDA